MLKKETPVAGTTSASLNLILHVCWLSLDNYPARMHFTQVRVQYTPHRPGEQSTVLSARRLHSYGPIVCLTTTTQRFPGVLPQTSPRFLLSPSSCRFATARLQQHKHTCSPTMTHSFEQRSLVGACDARVTPVANGLEKCMFLAAEHCPSGRDDLPGSHC